MPKALHRTFSTISIHSLPKEGDRTAPVNQVTSAISIHSLPKEGDEGEYAVITAADGFQSTPSPRRETCASCPVRDIFQFQSTPSPRRETDEAREKVNEVQISIHSLPKEGDQIQDRV